MNRELAALHAAHLSTVPTPDEVWAPVSAYHVDGLHPEVSRRLVRAMDAVSLNQTPPATVLTGERGSGKTHLLSWARQEIQSRGGYFFYIKLVSSQDFWQSAIGSVSDSLYRKDADGREQLARLLDELSRLAGLDDPTRVALTGDLPLQPGHVDALVDGVRRIDRQVGNLAADTVRALALLMSSERSVEIGLAYFAPNGNVVPGGAAWGLPDERKSAQLILRELTRIFALVGPIVFAFDQLDSLAYLSSASIAATASADSRAVRRLTSDIGAGLMDLREETRRTLMIVACQPNTWKKITEASFRSALDRFDVLPALGAIPDEATAAAIISQRLRPHYEKKGFTPDYPTWPIQNSALAEVPDRYTARRLLVRVNEHIARCDQSGIVVELVSLKDAPAETPVPESVDIDGLNAMFRGLQEKADVQRPVDKDAEDALMPTLLGAGLKGLVREMGGDEKRFEIETDFGRDAALHARLAYTLDEASETEIHWAFRAIATDSHLAAQNRIRKAVAAAGLEQGLPSRRLTLLRSTLYPGKDKTKVLIDDFDARGGQRIPIGAADIRTLSALRTMLDEDPDGLDAWLRRERPAAKVEIFATVLDDLRPHLGTAESADDPPPADVADTCTSDTSDIVLGHALRGGQPVTVTPDQLQKHTVVVGAAGSGKTVLIKRIIEQCALRGVSAIVLDPNDDLGRLGDQWPETPDGWTDEHEQEARRYFRSTEVVLWTPGLSRGRPLSFHPLPDFGPVLGDTDDFKRLLTSTVATLAPLARVRGDSARAVQQLSVLQRVLERYVREGGRTLDGFIEMLAEPPADLVNSRTGRYAVQMADTLEAAAETDPLFGGGGEPADPGVLLTPSPGRSARISVISFVGLSGDAAGRFVSRLQAALFSWFRAHPSGDRLGGLLVMDEAQNFVPSGAGNPSTDSTIELIRQIRKYGLGIVLASQAPRGINNQALGNTANQYIGRLTAPAQITAAQAMAQSRNAVLDDLGSLPVATFYVAGEGTSFRKTKVPICLSHHTGPLREDEVVARSHREVGRDGGTPPS